MSTNPIRTSPVRLAFALFGIFTLVALPLSADAARRSSSLRRKIEALGDEKVENLRIPILLGVEVDDIFDSWGDARSRGRSHEGTDILAPRGAFIVSPTDAVVSDIGVGANGGNFVYTTNPGGERLYFAHLDEYADGLDEGDVLEPGDLIGYVGNTGNAKNGPTHLHLGIYDRGAENPFPRLTKVFTLKERMEALDKIIGATRDDDEQDELVASLVAQYRPLFVQAQAAKIDLPSGVLEALGNPALTQAAALVRDLTVGMRGPDVVLLQQALIKQNKGASAKALAEAGATGYFGPVTQAALAEYQRAVGITPAAGYFGAITRARLQTSVAAAATL